MPTPLKRPLNPKDFNFAPIREGLSYDVILDGQLLEKEIEKSLSAKMSLKMIANRDISLNNIAVASVDENKQLTITTY